jgi:hypothetical protein
MSKGSRNRTTNWKAYREGYERALRQTGEGAVTRLREWRDQHPSATACACSLNTFRLLKEYWAGQRHFVVTGPSPGTLFWEDVAVRPDPQLTMDGFQEYQ